LSRQIAERTTISSTIYVIASTSDSSSRLPTTTYPADSVYQCGFNVSYTYHANSNVTSETKGAVTISRTFDNLGRVSTIGSVTGTATVLQNDVFQFDGVGNLTQRRWIDSSNNNYTESFTYDVLNRVLTSNGTVNKTFHTSKSDVGTYTYTSGTHRVASISGTINGVTNPTFAYDANGNMTSGAGVSSTWMSFNCRPP
jgi:hypothetical protein